MIFLEVVLFIESEDFIMEERLFRDTMSKFTTGITVVTIEHKNEVLGMTVNAFMSVSLEPKLIAISIDKKASMFEELKQADTFGVSILHADQKDISMHFASQLDSELEIDYEKRANVPVLKDALATISCNVNNKIEAGDHLIYLGEVIDLQISEHEKPLAYFNSSYQYF